MTKLANMAVLDRLKKLDKDNGTTDHVNHWKLLKGTDRLEFAVQLKVGRDASFMSVTESHAQINSNNNTNLQGLLIEAQVVAQEGLNQCHLVMHRSRCWLTVWRGCQAVILEALPIRPHEHAILRLPRATSSMNTLARP